jgi:hypothetical protein
VIKVGRELEFRVLRVSKGIKVGKVTQEIKAGKASKELEFRVLKDSRGTKAGKVM